MKKGTWRPIELELVLDGYIARVTRDRHGRWRWSATRGDVVERWMFKVVQHAFARGYSRSPEKAMRMAEAAIVALQRAEKAKKTPSMTLASEMTSFRSS